MRSSSRRVCVAAVLMALSGSVLPAAAEVERPQAVNGTFYAVVAPTYLVSSGAESYLRLYNGDNLSSTFTVTVVGSPGGTTRGTATYPVTARAAVQRSLGALLQDANVSGLASGDTGYSLYIQNPNQASGYQHVVYNGATTLFENASICKTLLNETIATLGPRAILMSVHTSALDPTSNKWPSTVVIHNYWNGAIAYKVTVIDEASGNVICPPGVSDTNQCGVTVQTQANETRLLDFRTFFEPALNWTPNANQIRVNLSVSDPTSSTAPNATVGHTVRNTQLGVDFNLTTACAVNAATSSVPAGGGGLSGY